MKNDKIIRKKYDLEFLKEYKWKDAFSSWKKSEADQDKWIKHFKERGFDSWEEWRGGFADFFGCNRLDWSLYKINKPLNTVPKFYGGPFKPWIKFFYGGKKTLSFAKLAESKKIQNYKGITDIINNFPLNNTLIGLAVGDKIFIIEGMHRSCAIALIAKNKENFRSNVNIYLARYNGKELPIPPEREVKSSKNI